MKKSYQHIVDFLFPVALFFVFTSTAILVLLLSANTYKGIINGSEENFESSTTLSYIMQKIRQNDDNNNSQIYLCEFDGCDALAISQMYNGQTYITYIYEVNNELKESFLREDVPACANSGTTIMKINELKMEQVQTNLLKFSCTLESGYTISTFINIHSTIN